MTKADYDEVSSKALSLFEFGFLQSLLLRFGLLGKLLHQKPPLRRNISSLLAFKPTTDCSITHSLRNISTRDKLVAIHHSDHTLVLP
ncbi:uncharacterized protein LOC141627024 isoform X3 [Silene latifolia]